MDVTSNEPEPPEQEWGHDLAATARAVDHAAPDVAAAYRTLFEQLVEQGFDDEQAIEIITEIDIVR